MTSNLPKVNVWGPSAWAGYDAPRPWHNLPAAIGEADPEQVMWGLAVGYAFAEAKSVAELPRLRSAAYDAWQAGAWGEDFADAVKKQLAEQSDIGPDGSLESLPHMLQNLASAVLPFGGGKALAHCLMFAAEGDPALERQLGLLPAHTAAENLFTAVKAWLAQWAQAWQAPNFKAQTPAEKLIQQLVHLQPHDFANMPAGLEASVLSAHTAHFALKLCQAEAHIAMTSLEALTRNHVAALSKATATGCYNALGIAEPCDPMGLGAKGVLSHVFAEGVYLPPMPHFSEGDCLSAGEKEALAAVWQSRNLEESLAEIFASQTYQGLPSMQSFAHVPHLNKQAILRQFWAGMEDLI